MAEEKTVKFDVDGYDVITTAIRELVNQYPALSKGDEIAFAILDEDSGKAIFPTSGAVIEAEKTDIIGNVTQTCLYPFYVIYRAGGLSEERKAAVKEWLDNLGKWLEKQKINVNGAEYRLSEYPLLSDNRKFLGISRQTPAHLDSINENQSENWVIQISARYQNKFNM